MQASPLTPIGTWRPGPTADAAPPTFSADGILRTVPRVREPVHVVRQSPDGRVGAAFGGEVSPPSANGDGTYPHLATLPALYPEWLGERSFLETHHVRFPYVSGAMANGIATPALVVAMAEAGMLGFYGAAGLSRERVEKGLDEIEAGLAGKDLPWGSNLIHSPNEPDLEDAVAGLYLERGVRRVSASAYMKLTPSIVRYAASGLTADADGRVQRKNHVFAKISRPEVALHFLSPPPAEILRVLVERGQLTPAESELAARIPVAGDITVESDSGGHTDNRPLAALFPVIRSLAEETPARFGYAGSVRVGAAGSLGTPSAVAAAFALGAAYVLTGSINQGALESGLSQEGRELLAKADLADVMMAPAADMFELGVKLQVLKRGTLFGVRALRLYELYRTYERIEQIPEAERLRVEKEIFQAPLTEIWADTRRFFETRDPREIVKAEKDPRHLMALVFRWYLGKSSQWAIAGDPARRADYQIWCGPAMGAFNAWTAGSFLADPARRGAVQIARNLLEGAAVVTRAQQLRTYGVAVPTAAFHFRPRRLV